MSLEQVVEDLSGKKAKLERSVTSLRANLNRDSAQHDQIKRAMPGLRQLTEALGAERAAATNELTALQPELARLSGRVREARRELASLDVEKARLEESLVGLNAEKAEHTARLNRKTQLATELSALSEHVEKQKAQLADDKGKASVLAADIRKLEQQRLELERSVNQLIGEKRALEAQKEPQE